MGHRGLAPKRSSAPYVAQSRSIQTRRSLSRSLAIRRQSLQIMTALRANDVAITQGVSVFLRDPDRNVIELRGREQGVVEGVTRYVP